MNREVEFLSANWPVTLPKLPPVRSFGHLRLPEIQGTVLGLLAFEIPHVGGNGGDVLLDDSHLLVLLRHGLRKMLLLRVDRERLGIDLALMRSSNGDFPRVPRKGLTPAS
jgi:hypothetical protein